jgi:outer membrane immunogenic protein
MEGQIMTQDLFARVLASALFVGASVSSVMAAEMPVKAAPAPIAAPTWTGWYVGVNAGGVWGNTDPGLIVQDALGGYFTFGIPGQAANLAAVEAANPSFRNSGFTAGGQVGYNFQSGIFVYGGEADLEYFHPSGSFRAAGVLPGALTAGGAPVTFAVTNTASADWLATFRTRVGVTNGNWLFFGTVGAAVAQLNFSGSYADISTAPPQISGSLRSNFSQSAVRAGIAAGGGVEWAVDRHWSVRAEYLYVQINDAPANALALPTVGVIPAPGACPPGGGATGFCSVFNYNTVFRDGIVRAALNYRF